MLVTLSAQEAFDLAKLLYFQGELKQSEEIFQQLFRANPSHAQILRFLGIISFKKGQSSEGLQLLQQALAQAPEDLEILLNLGSLLFHQKKFEDANVYFRRALQLNPDFLPAWKYLENTLTAQGEWREAISCLHQISIRFPEEAMYASLRFTGNLHAMCAKPPSMHDILLAIQNTVYDRPELTTRMRSLCGSAQITQSQLTQFNSHVAQITLDKLGCLYLALLWVSLIESCELQAAMSQPPFQTAHYLELLNDSSLPFQHHIQFLKNWLRFNFSSQREWNHFLFDRYVVPAIFDQLERGNILCAISLEEASAFSFAQQPHTESQARYCYEKVSPAFISAGKKLHAAWGAPLKRKSPEVPVVAFISNFSMNGCSPDQVLFNLLQGSFTHEKKDFFPVIAAFGSITDEVLAAFATAGIPVIDLTRIRDKPLSEDDIAQRLLTTREELAKHNVDVLCYYNTGDGFSDLANSAQLAPCQIYYSLGFHYIDSNRWDGLFAIGATGQTRKEIGGRIWHTLELSNPDPFGRQDGRQLIEQGKQIRNEKFGDYHLILASIGRPQKIDSDAFMDALACILTANPGAIFLWFGNTESISVREKMLVRGISERCLFQGFQSIPIYANVIDIHLDSFPFPSGLTMFDTMSAGVASVFMDTEVGRQIGLIAHIAPILRGEAGTAEEHNDMRRIFTYERTGESLFLLATNNDEYVTFTQRLIDDRMFREAVGKANLDFMKRFKFDLSVMSKSFVRRVQEVVCQE